MSSGSLAGGIGVWGDQPSPGGLRLASRYHGCAGVVGFAPFSSGLAGGFGVWGHPAFGPRVSPVGCVAAWGFLLLALWGGGGVGVWGHPAFGPRVSPVGCGAAWGFLLLALWGGGRVGVPVGGVAAWGISFPPSFLLSFFPSKQVNYE